MPRRIGRRTISKSVRGGGSISGIPSRASWLRSDWLCEGRGGGSAAGAGIGRGGAAAARDTPFGGAERSAGRRGRAPVAGFLARSLALTLSLQPSISLFGALSGLDVELAAVDLAAVERGDRLGRGAFGRDVDKPVAQARPGRRVAGDRRGQHNAERIERLGQPLIGKIRRQIADENIAFVVTHPHAIRVSRHPRWFFGKLRRSGRRVNSPTRYGTALLQCNDSGLRADDDRTEHAGIAFGTARESASSSV